MTTTTTPAGLATREGYDLPGAVLASWDGFLALLDAADLDAPTRLKGWRVREIAVHLGTWDGRSALSTAVESLGSKSVAEPYDVDADNAAIVRAHTRASDDEVRAAVRGSRDAVAEILTSSVVTEHGLEPVRSLLGPLPLLTLLHAGCYELAVHGLDVAAASGQHASGPVLTNGIAALADSTGCLAARTGVATTVTVAGGDDAWSFTSAKDGTWTVAPAPAKGKGPRLSASPTDLLEAASGRANAPLLLARRKIKIQDVPGLLALLPVVDKVPGIPGAAAITLAGKSLNGVGSLFGRLGRR